MQRLVSPFPIFLDARGGLIDGGKIYVGVAGSDPQTSPINLFWDIALTIPAAQPLRTIGGRIVNGVTPAPVYFAEADFSMRLTDADDVQVDYSTSVFVNASAFQPLDADLTAISNQGTTSYGRGLLALADQSALKTATGIPDPLPKAGGTVAGNIIRQGAGIHAYGADPAMTGMRIFNPLPTGSADPTSQPGDLIGYY